MAALTSQRVSRVASLTRVEFLVPIGIPYFKGGAVGIETMGTNRGKVLPIGHASGVALRYIGISKTNLAATATVRKIVVDGDVERWARYFANASAGDALAAGDVGSDAYFLDDQTVGIGATGRVKAGMVVGVDSTYGVLVAEFVPNADGGNLSPTGPALAFTANDCAPAALVHGATYDVPATAGVSTITLPAAAQSGTEVWFAADGTKNAHTVQYRDATGPVNLTTALVAAKRHLVCCKKLGAAWVANACVAP
jgi:hypothetical protein